MPLRCAALSPPLTNGHRSGVAGADKVAAGRGRAPRRRRIRREPFRRACARTQSLFSCLRVAARSERTQRPSVSAGRRARLATARKWQLRLRGHNHVVHNQLHRQVGGICDERGSPRSRLADPTAHLKAERTYARRVVDAKALNAVIELVSRAQTVRRRADEFGRGFASTTSGAAVPVVAGAAGLGAVPARHSCRRSGAM